MKVSICIATYNGEKYIGEQLSSILSQINSNDEIIISDDSSSDNTLSIIKSFNDPRISIYNSTARHPSFNFENALNKATGEIIFLSDQDDVWLENKVCIMSKALENADLVLSDCYVGDEKLKILHSSFFELYKCNIGWLKNILVNSYIGCSIAFHRKILEKALPFPKGKLLLHDYWIGMVAETYFSPKLIPDKLIIYRRHASNASPTTGVSNNSLLKKILIRFVILKGLFLNR